MNSDRLPPTDADRSGPAPEGARLARRTFLKRALGVSSSMMLLASCAPAAAPAPTTAPAKPAEPAKPAAPAAPAAPAPASSPAAAPAAPAASPAAAAPAASPAAAAKPAQAAPAAPATITKVRWGTVGATSTNPFVGIIGANRPEFMHKYGVEIDMIVTSTSPVTIQAMLGDSVDIAANAPQDGWAAIDKEPSLTQLIPITNGTPYSILVTPGIAKIEDLKGKVVGLNSVRGGGDGAALRTIFLEHGLKEERDYTIVAAGNVAARVQAMKAGSISATANVEPQIQQLKDEGFPEVDTGENYESTRNVTLLVNLARKKWVEANRDVAVNFIRAWMNITDWIYAPQNKDEVIDTIAKIQNVDKRLATAVFSRSVEVTKIFPRSPLIDLKRFQQVATNERNTGNPNVPTDFAKYIDNSIAEAAIAAKW